ncbi:MAG: asparagine synthase (glutamine-hydrolyzing), partial [Desulfatirhabdiaceae bacterium]
MCGIAGFVSRKGDRDASPDRLTSMVQTLFHRGPDESGMAIHDGVAMGMRRLSIIDLSGGQQPIYNEDQTIWTVFNGEIYNFKTLRRELIKKGHVFRTQSDTEVIVHAYEEYETEFPRYLNGMFAIAIHDRKRKRLMLVRDHIGIKPLYYSMDNKDLIFGSEIKAILASGLVNRELNIAGLAAFLAWEYVPGKATLFRSVNKLEPGCYLDIHLDDRQAFMRAYWDIPAPFQSQACRNESEWADAVDQQIQKSTRMQMISDVPLGAFLSGGVDSSLIVSAMGQARTFSIGFDDPTYNELPWARKVADYLG